MNVPQAPALNIDFTFLTDEQRVILANAIKQAIVPLLQEVLTKIALPPFNQAMGKYINILSNVHFLYGNTN